MGAPLRNGTFRRIWLASLLSNLGLFIQGVGAAWAMTQMTSSAELIALVQTALMLPINAVITCRWRNCRHVRSANRWAGGSVRRPGRCNGLVDSCPSQSRYSDYPSCFLLYHWDRNGLVWTRLAGLRQRASTFVSAAGCHLRSTRSATTSLGASVPRSAVSS